MSAHSNESPSAEFVALLRGGAIKPQDVASLLDGMSGEERVKSLRSTKLADQRKLYDVVEGFAPVSLVDMVPPGVADEATVRHYGQNSLPLFSEFEKRFSRLPGNDPADPAELIGFNFQTMAPVTGPGYYVAVDDEARGEVLVDYRRVPDRHPADWPEIRSNERGLSRFVYGFMVDTLRRVSEHVTIGRANRHGKDQNNWFILCREV